jgi:hypothetical protein
MSLTSWEHGGSAPTIRQAPRPAPETGRLIQFSCQRLLVAEPEFAGAFHRELCDLTSRSLPVITSVGALSGALAHCVLWAALTRDSADSVESRVRAFAADQHARGFPDEAYPCLCHALLRSVRTTLPTGWSSELSSGWVSYGLWLQPHLELGAHSTPEQAGPASPATPLSLDAILDHLRSRYFPGQDRALSAICTRVMLRTGADLRTPRPEQRTDPRVIAHVLESLLLMGFAPVQGPLQPALGTPVPGLPVPGTPVPATPVPGMPAPAVVPSHDRTGASDRRPGASDSRGSVPDQRAGERRHHWGFRRHRTNRRELRDRPTDRPSSD